MRETKYKEFPPHIPELAALEMELLTGRFTTKEVSNCLYAAYLVGLEQGWAIEMDRHIGDAFDEEI